jgi:hypothetical protein
VARRELALPEGARIEAGAGAIAVLILDELVVETELEAVVLPAASPDLAMKQERHVGTVAATGARRLGPAPVAASLSVTRERQCEGESERDSATAEEAE